MKFDTTNVNFVGKEILSTGTIVVMNEKIQFTIQDLVYIMSFSNDDNNKETRTEILSNDGKRVELCLYNFNNGLGVGPNESWTLGNINGNNLLFSFVISNWGAGILMHYTWYIGGNHVEQ